MITNSSQFCYVQGLAVDDDHPYGDLDRIDMSVDIMLRRQGVQKNIPYGKDVALIYEAAAERLNWWSSWQNVVNPTDRKLSNPNHLEDGQFSRVMTIYKHPVETFYEPGIYKAGAEAVDKLFSGNTSNGFFFADMNYDFPNRSVAMRDDARAVTMNEALETFVGWLKTSDRIHDPSHYSYPTILKKDDVEDLYRSINLAKHGMIVSQVGLSYNGSNGQIFELERQGTEREPTPSSFGFYSSSWMTSENGFWNYYHSLNSRYSASAPISYSIYNTRPESVKYYSIERWSVFEYRQYGSGIVDNRSWWVFSPCNSVPTGKSYVDTVAEFLNVNLLRASMPSVVTDTFDFSFERSSSMTLAVAKFSDRVF